MVRRRGNFCRILFRGIPVGLDMMFQSKICFISSKQYILKISKENIFRPDPFAWGIIRS